MAKQRIEKLRITRNGTQRYRSLAGGTVIGDFIDVNGERVITIEKVAPITAKPKKSKAVEAKAVEAIDPLAKQG